MSAISNLISNIWGLFGARFRAGLSSFLQEHLKRVLKIGYSMLQEHQFNDAHEFFQIFWSKLRVEYPNTPGTWLTIIAGLALDMYKGEGYFPETTAQPEPTTVRASRPTLR